MQPLQGRGSLKPHWHRPGLGATVPMLQGVHWETEVSPGVSMPGFGGCCHLLKVPGGQGEKVPVGSVAVQ